MSAPRNAEAEAESDLDPPTVKTDTTSNPGITLITLDRKRRANAVNAATARRLYDAFLAFESAPTQKVCVFHGAHGNFCAGFDLHELSGAGQTVGGETGTTATATATASAEGQGGPGVPDAPSPATSPAAAAAVLGMGPMGPSRLQLSKPVICAVAGYAVAGGLELSLLGDIRVAEEDAVFGVFCRRFGVPLVDGGTVRLQKVVGLGRALDMVLTGRPVGAREALGMGLANYLVPKGKGVEKALEIARELAGFPQACMRVDRAGVYYAAYRAVSFGDAIGKETERGMEVVKEESVQGARKFKEGLGRHGRFDRGSKL